MKKTKQLTFCAIMSALGVVILLLGSVLEIFDLCSVLIAAILIFVVCEELGNAKAMATYAVCMILSFLIVPSKLVALEYLIFGFYPVLRRILEGYSRPICISLKALYMLASATATLAIIRLVFTTAETTSLFLEIATAIMGIACLILCDIVFKRFSKYYHIKLRKMLRIDKFFS